MSIRNLSNIALIILLIVLIGGCQLDPQAASEKMAFNNTMQEIKATNFMDGKVGNIKFTKNMGYIGFTFDVTDSSLTKEQVEDLCYKLLTIYANNNNKAKTGITVIKIVGTTSLGTVRATYQAGPSIGDDIRSNVTIAWE